MKLRFFLLLLVLPIYPTVAHSQDTLPPLVVQSTRLKDVEEPITKVPEKVIVITADDIKTLGAKTIQEALQYQTGMVLYDQVGNDFQSTIDMRGFNGQPVTTTVVFVDGVRINEPDFNTINFDLIPDRGHRAHRNPSRDRNGVWSKCVGRRYQHHDQTGANRGATFWR